ncbi:hypothetical protein M0R72_07695 [Candidatus Pacearchaeota archaeon]|jgi:hypothetical protein|nr:hypothetical protein [Candidatus Pacearchaeota archaeon]
MQLMIDVGELSNGAADGLVDALRKVMLICEFSPRVVAPALLLATVGETVLGEGLVKQTNNDRGRVMITASYEAIREMMEDKDLLAMRAAYQDEVKQICREYAKGIRECIEFPGFQETQEQVLNGFQRNLKAVHQAWYLLAKRVPGMFEQIAKEISASSGDTHADSSETTDN